MLRSYTKIILFALLLNGVFGDAERVKSVSVKEGDPVTLYADVNKQYHDIMRWYFNDTRITLISGDPSRSCLYDGEGGRFRDRLKVDYETGSLTIRDITTEDAGLYEAEFIKIDSSGKTETFIRPKKCDGTKIGKKPSNTQDIIKTFRLTVTASDSGNSEHRHKMERADSGSGLSPGAVAGIVDVLLLVVAAVLGVVI